MGLSMELDDREPSSAELATADRDVIFESLDRITTSAAFRSKPVIVKMLTYLVTEFVEGRSEQIKGYNIGLDVFGLGKDFDPNSNPLVRNNAVRLRELLRTYNEGEGRGDPVRIEVPKGKYIPRITRTDSCSESTAEAPAADRGRSVVVLPFRNLSRDEDLEYLTRGFSHQLTDALARYEDLRVIGSNRRFDGEDGGAELLSKGITFVVDGDVRRAGNKLQISCRLASTEDGVQLWGESYRLDVEKDDLFEFEDAVTAHSAMHIGSEFGPVNRARFAALKSQDRTLDEQSVLLRWYHLLSLPLAPESSLAFRDYAADALAADPESALLNAIVANVSHTIWINEYPGADAAFKTFVELSQKAYEIDPNNEYVLTAMAARCFVFEEREKFVSLFDKVVNRAVKSPLRSGGWAFWACFLGEWGRGKRLLDEIMASNVDVPLWFHIVESLYHYKNCDYEKALEEACRMQPDSEFWGVVCRLIALSQLGRTSEANQEFEVLLSRRPDFIERGRELLGRYLKDRTLREHLFAGIEKIGVTLA